MRCADIATTMYVCYLLFMSWYVSSYLRSLFIKFACPSMSLWVTLCTLFSQPWTRRFTFLPSECGPLVKPEGSVVECNETDTVKRCSITCRPGLFFTAYVSPHYECGLETAYSWSHETYDNPNSTLPSCSSKCNVTRGYIAITPYYYTYTYPKLLSLIMVGNVVSMCYRL
jgi:hypothetical protein